MKMIYNVEDKPAWSKLLVYAFQQVLAIMAATILVPMLIGKSAQMSAAILGAGIGTIVYLLFTRFKSPVCISSSFAFISALIGASAFGFLGIIVGGILAGLVYVVLAIIIHFAGSNWVSKLMPPIIIGPTVAIIGLGLASSAMSQIATADASIHNGGYNLIALFCGLVTFVTVVICSIQKKNKGLRLIPFIVGIGVGYCVALIFTLIGYAAKADYLMVLNWNPLVENFVVDGKFTGVTAFLNYPRFALLEGIIELKDKTYTLNWAGFGEIALAFIPVALVVFAEHIADHKNLGSIIDRDLVGKEPGLERTLLGDGVGSIAGTLFGICPNTTYGESVGCVAITKNASVITIFVAACMCIVLSFLSPVIALLQTIPNCVMGGVCLTLYGFIAVSGLKMFKDIDLGENKNLFTVSAILIAGIGGLSIQIPYRLDGEGAVANAITITSVATALLLGIMTYAICNFIEKKQKDVPNEEDAESLMAAPIEADSTYEVESNNDKNE
jgi:uracil permease